MTRACLRTLLTHLARIRSNRRWFWRSVLSQRRPATRKSPSSSAWPTLKKKSSSWRLTNRSWKTSTLSVMRFTVLSCPTHSTWLDGLTLSPRTSWISSMCFWRTLTSPSVRSRDVPFFLFHQVMPPQVKSPPAKTKPRVWRELYFIGLAKSRTFSSKTQRLP